jgi:hypothetical protein
MALLRFQPLVALDPGDLLHDNPEARWASWQRAGQAGILSPNEVRSEEGWPASSDPTADTIEPPTMGRREAGRGRRAEAACTRAAVGCEGEGASKIARLDQRTSTKSSRRWNKHTRLAGTDNQPVYLAFLAVSTGSCGCSAISPEAPGSPAGGADLFCA